MQDIANAGTGVLRVLGDRKKTAHWCSLAGLSSVTALVSAVTLAKIDILVHREGDHTFLAIYRSQKHILSRELDAGKREQVRRRSVGQMNRSLHLVGLAVVSHTKHYWLE